MKNEKETTPGSQLSERDRKRRFLREVIALRAKATDKTPLEVLREMVYEMEQKKKAQRPQEEK